MIRNKLRKPSYVDRDAAPTNLINAAPVMPRFCTCLDDGTNIYPEMRSALEERYWDFSDATNGPSPVVTPYSPLYAQCSRSYVFQKLREDINDILRESLI